MTSEYLANSCLIYNFNDVPFALLTRCRHMSLTTGSGRRGWSPTGSCCGSYRLVPGAHVWEWTATGRHRPRPSTPRRLRHPAVGVYNVGALPLSIPGQSCSCTAVTDA